MQPIDRRKPVVLSCCALRFWRANRAVSRLDLACDSDRCHRGSTPLGLPQPRRSAAAFSPAGARKRQPCRCCSVLPGSSDNGRRLRSTSSRGSSVSASAHGVHCAAQCRGRIHHRMGLETAPLPAVCCLPVLRRRPPSLSQHSPPAVTTPWLAGNMPVKPNKYIEEWGTRREHIEKEFRCGCVGSSGAALCIPVHRRIEPSQEQERCQAPQGSD